MRNFFDDEETKVNDELFDNTLRGTVSEESFEEKKPKSRKNLLKTNKQKNLLIKIPLLLLMQKGKKKKQ